MEAECEQLHAAAAGGGGGGGVDEEQAAGAAGAAGAADGAMLWSLQEALQRQTLQIGVSACGATAVVDVLKALGVDVEPEEA
ncbi:hypothetical protein GBF38_000463, partial [Nibea albiflora]